MTQSWVSDSRNNPAFRAITAIACLCLLCFCTNAATSGSSETSTSPTAEIVSGSFRDLLEKALNEGKVSVLIVLSSAPETDSEWYSDWFYYLHEFRQNADPKFVFFEVPPTELNDVLVDPEQYSEEYSLIFLSTDKAALYTDGPVFEAMFYDYAREYYGGGEIAPILQSFADYQVNIELK